MSQMTKFSHKFNWNDSNNSSRVILCTVITCDNDSMIHEYNSMIVQLHILHDQI